MKKGIFLLLSLFSLTAFAANMTAMRFYQTGELSTLELEFDEANVNAEKFHVQEDKQILLDLENTEATDRVMRAFDTSEFSGAVVFVSAYQKPNEKKDLRIALQLRDNVRSRLTRKPNKILLTMENRFGVFSQLQVEESQTVEEKINEANLGKVHVPKSSSIEDILENLTLAGRKKYIGKKISFNVKNIPVEDILKMIADASGFNIIITEEVKKLPPLTLSLTNIPWDQSLDTILGLNRLVAKKNGVILMITTLEKATEEKKIEIAAKKLSEEQEPLVTKVFPISYATIDELETIIVQYLTKDRGSLSKDQRTNSIIVKDTAEIIEKIRRIVEALDTQTPQVLIESKIVEVTEAYTKEIGLQEGVNFGYDPIGNIDPGLASAPIGGSVLPGVDSGDAGPGFSFSSAPSTGDNARNLFGVSITRFNRLFNLNFTLQLMESESKGKVISSPKIITQNKKRAEINTKDTTSYAVQTGIGADATTSFEETEANLKLAVTPQVTNEGSIALEVELAKEQFLDRPSPNAPPNKSARDIKTNVLVDNGSTIVIGGIYNFVKSEVISGVPFLKDIPLLGWLFRTAYKPQTNKNEMIIFLTPRIINQEEAGLIDRT